MENNKKKSFFPQSILANLGIMFGGWLLATISMGQNNPVFQVLGGVGSIGAIFGFIGLIVSIIKNIKKKKQILGF